MPKIPKVPTPSTDFMPPNVRIVLRREFATFFTGMLTPEPGWPAISDQQFVDALADSIITVGNRNHRGIAMLQTLIYDLQEQVNRKLVDAH